MKTFDMTTLRSWKPCYDPARHLPEDWTGTALDILDNKAIPFKDRLWVICRTDLVSEKLMRLFAVWCARQVQHLMKDERSIHTLDFMEAYCENRFLIEDPDWTAGWEEERAAASDAAWDAASDAAWAAAWAARAAASDATMAAAWATMAAAWAARAAARAAQETKLREMLLAGVDTGDTL